MAAATGSIAAVTLGLLLRAFPPHYSGRSGRNGHGFFGGCDHVADATATAGPRILPALSARAFDRLVAVPSHDGSAYLQFHPGDRGPRPVQPRLRHGRPDDRVAAGGRAMARLHVPGGFSAHL